MKSDATASHYTSSAYKPNWSNAIRSYVCSEHLMQLPMKTDFCAYERTRFVCVWWTMKIQQTIKNINHHKNGASIKMFEVCACVRACVSMWPMNYIYLRRFDIFDASKEKNNEEIWESINASARITREMHFGFSIFCFSAFFLVSNCIVIWFHVVFRWSHLWYFTLSLTLSLVFWWASALSLL